MVNEVARLGVGVRRLGPGPPRRGSDPHRGLYRAGWSFPTCPGSRFCFFKGLLNLMEQRMYPESVCSYTTLGFKTKEVCRSRAELS